MLTNIINEINKEVKSLGVDFWTFDQYKEYALELLSHLGWVSIPMHISRLRDGKFNKKPLVPWRVLTSRKPTPEELERIWEEAVANKTLVKKFGKLGEETRDLKKEQRATAIGVICGRTSQITVIDIDDIEKFTSQTGISKEELKNLISSTLTTKTPSGGLHLYFAYDPDLSTTTVQNAGFDIRNDGSLVVIPPSRLPAEEGGEVLYKVLNDVEKLPSIPKELKQKLLKVLPKRKPTPKEEDKKEVFIPQRWRRLPEVEIQKLVELFVPVWQEGHRHYLSVYLAGTLFKSGIEEETAKDIVARIASIAGDEEEGQRVYQVHYTYQRGLAGEEIKGITGLEEELDSLIEEGIITEKGKYNILSTLQEILGIPREKGLSVFVLLQEDPPAGVANLAKKKVIIEWKKTKDGEFKFGKKIVNAYLTKAVVKYEPDTQLRYFEVEFESKSGKRFTFEGTAAEIASALRGAGLHAVDRNKLEPYLASLITTLEDKQMVEVKESPRNKGFFLSSNGELIANLPFFEQNDFDPEMVKKALNYLTAYVEVWGREKMRELATVIKFHITAPFYFIRKKLSNDPFRWLFVVGIKDTGKTQDARLARAFFGEEEEVVGPSSISTPARLARAISKTTLPLVVDEAASLFPSGARTDSREYEIVEELKRVWGTIVARRTHRNYQYIEELALAPIIFTANRSPLLDPPLRKRIFVIEYPQSAAVKDKETKKGFSMFLQGISEYLPWIGYATYLFLKENLNLIKEAGSFQELGEKILEHLYSTYLGSVPEWVSLEAEEVAEMEELDNEQVAVEDIARITIKYLGEVIREGLGKEEWKRLLSKDVCISELIEVARKTDPTIPIAVYEPKDSFDMHIAFRRQFLQVLAENNIEIPTLKALGELFQEHGGGFHSSTRVRSAGWASVSIAYAPTRIFNEVLKNLTGGDDDGHDSYNFPDGLNF